MDGVAPAQCYGPPVSTIHERIESKLSASLTPVHLEVINESHMHKVPPGSETHFKVVVVSDRFDGLSAVKRHQLVYAALGERMREEIHALSMQTLTPDEWRKARNSP